MSSHASLFDDPDLIDEDEAYEDDPVTYEDDDPSPPPPDDDADDDEEEAEADDNEVAVEDPVAADMDMAPQAESEPSAAPPPVVRYAKLEDLRIEYRFWTNPRTQTGLDGAKLGELAASIIARTIHPGTEGEPTVVGITDPLKIVPIANNGDVDLLITDGQRRYLAACQAFDPPGDELVPVIYQEQDPVQWTQDLANRYYVEALHGVGTREGLSAFELSEAAARLRASNDPDGGGKQYTLSRIAKELNRSESWVSKILTAREAASPTLLAKWRRGDITEEQFRDLATVKDKGEQTAKAEEVSQAQGQGRGAARAVAKEQKLIASKERQATKAKEQKPAKTAAREPKQAVRGPQAELPNVAAAPAEPRKPKPMSFAVVEDVVSTAEKHPPTHDMVKGIILGMKVASGMLDAGELPKPWQTYLLKVAARSEAARKSGAKPSKPAKKSKSKK